MNPRTHLGRALVLAAALLSTPVRAHGGEDHGAPARPSTISSGAEHAVAGETTKFSVVVKYPARKAAGPLAAHVYVARADTSEPVPGAQVRVELKGASTFEGNATKTDAPGVYEIALPSPPDGVIANGVISVEAKDDFDLVLLGDLPFGPVAMAAATPGVPHQNFPLWAMVSVAGALAALTGVLGFVLGRRERPVIRVAPLILATLVALSAVNHRAQAHGGEDHGAPAKPSAAVAQDPGSAHLPIETQFLLGLRTERVKRGTLASGLGQVGTAVARPTGDLVLVAPTSGRIFPPDSGFVRLGDEVKKGQILGSFRPILGGAESAQLGLSRSDATSRMSSAEARLTLAERELQRRKDLKGIVADKEIQEAEAEVEVARSELQRARADVGSLAGGAGVQKLVSTLDGTVVLGQVSPGAHFAGGAEIWRIVDLSTLWIDVRVPESDATRLSQAVAEMALVADPAIRFTGKRIATGSLIDPATRTVQTLFEIDNKDRRVRVGSLVSVVVTTGAPVESVVVPSAALLDRSGTPVVIVKTAPEAFEVRSVAVGPKAGGSIGIQAGVRAGERVVVDGAMAVLLAAGG